MVEKTTSSLTLFNYTKPSTSTHQFSINTGHSPEPASSQLGQNVPFDLQLNWSNQCQTLTYIFFWLYMVAALVATWTLILDRSLAVELVFGARSHRKPWQDELHKFSLLKEGVFEITQLIPALIVTTRSCLVLSGPVPGPSTFRTRDQIVNRQIVSPQSSLFTVIVTVPISTVPPTPSPDRPFLSPFDGQVFSSLTHTTSRSRQLPQLRALIGETQYETTTPPTTNPRIPQTDRSGWPDAVTSVWRIQNHQLGDLQRNHHRGAQPLRMFWSMFAPTITKLYEVREALAVSNERLQRLTPNPTPLQVIAIQLLLQTRQRTHPPIHHSIANCLDRL